MQKSKIEVANGNDLYRLVADVDKGRTTAPRGLHMGRSWSDDDESWTDYLCLPMALVEAAGLHGEEMEADLLDYLTDSYYGGPGRPFCSSAYIVRSNTRILILQDGGLDV